LNGSCQALSRSKQFWGIRRGRANSHRPEVAPEDLPKSLAPRVEIDGECVLIPGDESGIEAIRQLFETLGIVHGHMQ
jgi:hypothetical protein